MKSLKRGKKVNLQTREEEILLIMQLFWVALYDKKNSPVIFHSQKSNEGRELVHCLVHLMGSVCKSRLQGGKNVKF